MIFIRYVKYVGFVIFLTCYICNVFTFERFVIIVICASLAICVHQKYLQYIYIYFFVCTFNFLLVHGCDICDIWKFHLKIFLYLLYLLYSLFCDSSACKTLRKTDVFAHEVNVHYCLLETSWFNLVFFLSCSSSCFQMTRLVLHALWLYRHTATGY